MSSKNSKKVAYASQYTDVAAYEHEIEFENGGRFRQSLSAHIVCRENIELAQTLVREAAALRNKPYILHRLGIALHIYADTLSHRECSGDRYELNEVEACREIYAEIDYFLSGNGHPEYRTENILKWEEIKHILIDLFRDNKNPDRRGHIWKRHINRSTFGFTCQPVEKDLSYDDTEWFNDAVDVHITPEGKRTYTRKANFYTSDWKYFHDAAASHRSFVLNELLAPVRVG